MKQYAWLFFCIILLSGCVPDINSDGFITIAFLGDSNTVERDYPGVAPELLLDNWPTYMTRDFAPPGWKVLNIAWIGHTVTNPAHALWQLHCAQQQLDFWQCTSIIPQDPKHPAMDALIAAFGTNDLRTSSNEEIVAGYQQLIAAAAPIKTFIATVPPYTGSDAALYDATARVPQINQLIRFTFPAWQVIDFDTGFTSEYFDYNDSPGDGVHLNKSGQILRALRAWNVINKL